MKGTLCSELDQLDWPMGIQRWLSGQQRPMRIIAAAPPRVARKIAKSVLDALGASANACPRRQTSNYGLQDWFCLVKNRDVGEFNLTDYYLRLGASVVEFGVTQRLAQPLR